MIVHQIGNASQDEGYELSDHVVDIDEPLHQILLSYFTSAISGEELYHLHNDIGLDQNEIYHLAKKIFEDPASLPKLSQTIAAHLYRHSKHPRIKSGELYIACLEGVIIEDEVTNAIGIFKSESKETFLNVNIRDKVASIQYNDGIPAQKPDKACLIINTDADKGYKVYIYDYLNKSNEAGFWKDDFLGVQHSGDDYYMTSQMMELTKQFVAHSYAGDFDASKVQQADILQRSVNYFKNNDTFDNQAFAQSVFDHSDVRDSFHNFQDEQLSNEIFNQDKTFSISVPAVKKQARLFKSVIKLDKNFHIYIHGNNELIEQGVDEEGRKYYKIYYDNES